MKQLASVQTTVLGGRAVRFRWDPKGRLLAVGGVERTVCVYDRTGAQIDQIVLPPVDDIAPKPEKGKAVDPRQVAALEWDASGEKLAIMATGTAQVTLWSATSRQKQFIEMAPSAAHTLTWMGWSRLTTGPGAATLAVGTAKGALMLYDDKHARKVPVMGKHSKAITCGAWSINGTLVLGSEDKTVTVSLSNGDTLKTLPMAHRPWSFQFGTRPTGADGGAVTRLGTRGPNVLSIIIGGLSLLTYSIDGQGMPNDSPVELVFKASYGTLMSHQWVGTSGLLVLGFQNGYVNVVDGREGHSQNALFTERLHTDYMVMCAYSESLQRLATLGKHSLRVVDMAGAGASAQFRELKDDAIDYSQNFYMTEIAWTADGQMLTTANETGVVTLLLASLPVVNAAFGSRAAYLTSLLEMSIADVVTGWRVYVKLEAEPSLVAMGESHAAAGLNNQVWFYAVEEDQSQPLDAAGVANTTKVIRHVTKRDYLGAVKAVCMNAQWAAVLAQGRVLLHAIELSADPEDAMAITLPEGDRGEVTCVAMTPAFLVYATDSGLVCYYDVGARAAVNEYRHARGTVRALYPNHSGTRVVMVDDSNDLWLYNPVNDQVLEVPQFEGEFERIIWDLAQPHVFVVATRRELHCMLYSPVTISGPSVTLLGTDSLLTGHSPVTLNNGVVAVQGAGGELSRVRLHSHRHVQPLEAGAPLDAASLSLRCEQLLALRRLAEAWECAVQLREPAVWEELVRVALNQLEVGLAIRVYRAVGEAGMVQALEAVAGIDDRVLLAGHVTLLLSGDTEAAQDLFLRSSRPAAALEMRKDLKQWEAALALAQQLDAQHGTGAQLPEICRENAALLEARGEYERSLAFYERALGYSDGDDPTRDAARNAACVAGMARVCVRLGDARRGRQLALDANSETLCRECAAIFEEMGLLTEAAEMYQHGGQHERAASIYIATKAFSLAKPLMSRIKSPKLQLQYARAKEAEGRFDDAADAYEAAGANDYLVRVCLDRLGDEKRAFAIVRRARSQESANIAARYCAARNDHTRTIEFLAMAGRLEEAFACATEHRLIDAYAATLGDSAPAEEYQRLARWYEGQGEHEKAGRLYERCEEWAPALKLYLRCGGALLDDAIELVGKAGNDALTNQLVDHLMGESDGVPKDHNYLFRLHMALGNYDQAARAAVLVAQQEQELGQYKVAHAQLLSTTRELRRQSRRAPNELSRQLMLLHSYVLVRSQVRMGNHEQAARLLVRVARNISRFPAHVVPILTSTVIECVKAGFKALALEYATVLVRPEYRSQIAPAYKKKIEGMVRRPDKEAQLPPPPEPTKPCPFCGAEVPEMDLECSSCKNILPYCVASGKHMVLDSWTQCPACKFPALYYEFMTVLQNDKACPMCSETDIPLASIKVLDDPLGVLRADRPPSSVEGR
eukprot:PRCOL_00000438-RA